MKKIISIILGILLMFAMSVPSFAAKTDVITPNPETITFEIACTHAAHAIDEDGKSLNDMIYTFSTTVINQTKADINMSDYAIALVFINEDTHENIDAKNITLIDDQVESNYQKEWADKDYDNDWTFEGHETVKTYVSNNSINKVRMNYDKPTSVDIKVYVNGQTVEKMITKVDKDSADPVKITLDVTPKATPEAPTTETTTDAPTEAPTQAPTEAPTEAPTQAPTKAPEVTDSVEEDYIAPPVDDTIPDTGATVPFAAIGTLVTSAITALVAKKKKEN